MDNSPSSNSLPLQGRSENRLKRGESFLIPREDRAALVFFINRNYEKNLAELLPGHPLRGNRPTLRKTSERGREGEIRKAFEAQGSNLENRYTASPPLPSPLLFLFLSKQSRLVRKFLSSLFPPPPPPRMNINSIHSIKISVLQREINAKIGWTTLIPSPSPLCFPGHDVLINFYGIFRISRLLVGR